MHRELETCNVFALSRYAVGFATDFVLMDCLHSRSRLRPCDAVRDMEWLVRLRRREHVLEHGVQQRLWQPQVLVCVLQGGRHVPDL
jgi:hypothetical protein